MLIMKTIICCLLLLFHSAHGFDPEDVWGETTLEELEEYYKTIKKMDKKEFAKAMMENAEEERKATEDILERSLRIDREFKRGIYAPRDLDHVQEDEEPEKDDKSWPKDPGSTLSEAPKKEEQD